MPKLSDIKINPALFRGRGIRPWNDSNVVKPSIKKATNTGLSKRKQTVSKQLANREQIVSNALANSEQIDLSKKECVSNALAQPLAIELAMGEQTVSNALASSNKTKDNETIETLVGNERNLLKFLFQKCQLIGSLESSPITTDELKNILKINAVHLRNLIYRLSNKNIIKISKLKNGRSGWRKFRFSKDIFQYLSLEQSVSKALANREPTVSNGLAKALAEPLAIIPSSSGSLNILKNTTTSEAGARSIQTIPEEWQLDIEPLTKIGFTATHLRQISSQNKLSPQQVQDSIYAFAFDLEKNDKAKKINGDPISYFMGILRNGRVYTFSSNYESPQNASMRLYVENRRRLEKEREELEKEAIDLAFNGWFVQLTEEQKREFLPEMLRNTPNLERNKLLKNTALSHFKTEIWPSKRNEIVDEAGKATGSTRSEEVTEEKKT